MEYKIETFPNDKIYIGMKYCKNENSNYNDIPSFWSYVTEKLYNSKLVENLIDNNEAIGHRQYISPNDRTTFDYYVACEIKHFQEDTCGFDKIIIRKGDYILFKVNYKNKDNEIKEIVDHLNNQTEYSINKQFDFEYYTADFDHNDLGTHFYLAAQIIIDH